MTMLRFTKCHNLGWNFLSPEAVKIKTSGAAKISFLLWVRYKFDVIESCDYFSSELSTYEAFSGLVIFHCGPVPMTS